MPEFVSLHHHSTYSFMDGYGTPDEHVARAAELGYGAMALTEHGNVSSHFRFEAAAGKSDIKPIFGLEAYTASTFTAKQQTKWHLTLLAMDTPGYVNLNRAVTQSYRDFYYQPTLLGDNLAEHSDGLICLSGCNGSLLACTLIGGKGIPEPPRPDLRAAQRVAERFADLFGDRYYLEVQCFPELEKSQVINRAYEKISAATGIPLVATLDVHYPQPTDNDMQLLLHAIGRGHHTVDDAAREWNYDVLLTLPESDDDIYRKLIDTGLSRGAARDAMATTADIAGRCNVTLPKADRLRFPCPKDITATDLIWQWLREGWAYRGIGGRPRAEQDWYADRVKYEMKLVEEKDFIDFFLATSDVVKWAKDNGIPVGPGRGSAAASVVCWLLRITEIDPHRYQGMLFERFMDVNRADPPDIDLDFSDERRHEIRGYLEDKYGPDCVGTIATFVRYRGKNSLVDTARVNEVPHGAQQTVKNLLIERSGGDSRASETLGDTVQAFPNAAAVFDAYPVLWQATRLEGQVKGLSIHAAGQVVANSNLTDICAVYEREGRQVLSVDKYDTEYAGMLKMDFLGLTTMGMIQLCLDMTDLTLEDLYGVPDTDQHTLEVFKTGDVIGIFQFEGRATRVVNRDVRPDSFAEVADVNALSRPGPLFSGTTAEYCDVKWGRREAEHYHAIVDDVTRDTYGQIIYQEQILRILKEIGGFDWFSVGQIRRIISKKLGEAAFQMSYNQFEKGALELHGIDNALALRIWKKIVTSGTYSFNIAHAISYSMLAWWCAYLKSHHPREFYAACLAKSEPGSDSEFKLMTDAVRHGIKIKPPSLTESGVTWAPAVARNTPAVLAGFTVVPGIGSRIAEAIVRQRAETPFSSWKDLTKTPGIASKKAATIQAFCMMRDPFNLTRTRDTLLRVWDAIKAGQISCPLPTHNGEHVADIEVPWGSRHKEWLKGELVIFAGIVKARNYQDTIENIHSRTGDDLDAIRKRLKQPDLVTSCVLQCYDATMEEVYLRINRFAYPRWRRTLESITVGHDVIIGVGHKTSGFGNSLAIEKMYVIDPEE